MTAGSRRTIEVNRAPVLTLWAAVVAERLGFRHGEALTLGLAVAGLNAYSKGVSLGLIHPARKAAAAVLPWVATCALVAVVAGCATSRGSVPALPPGPMEGGVQTGQASWYGEPHHGRRTASGEIFDMYQLTAAHPTLPFGTRVLVTNLKNERSVEVRINDRGPTVANRIIDLSYAAAQKLGALSGGPVPVRLRVIPTPSR